ncbi:MAG: thiolase family protein [Deltaproteobacteria bacterium]|nr:thiolase family protein [Deltaproteobacteria bacterium]
MSKGKLAIIGIGEVPTGRYPERSRWDIIYEVCQQAVRDAGIDKNDIEGVITVAPQAQPRLIAEISFGKIPEELGLKGCKDICICNAGGASSANCLRLAEQWIESGLAKIVLIPHVTVHSTIPVEDLIGFFATAGMDLQWEYPFGTTYNAITAMMTRRYMYESGTTEEEMASVVVALRKWAAMDPNSMFYKKPVTLEDVLGSKMISSPLRSRECNVLGDGGAAMVVTSAELAAKITETPVYKLGQGARYLGACPVLRKDFFMKNAWQESSKDALEEAGMAASGLDILEIYGAYPVLQCVIMEALGVCEPGQAGKFIKEGHTSPGGKLPCATMGDAIGRGHTGSGVSIANYVETARQLMGKAGERQVPDCKTALATSAGGSGMNAITTIWGRELS